MLTQSRCFENEVIVPSRMESRNPNDTHERCLKMKNGPPEETRKPMTRNQRCLKRRMILLQDGTKGSECYPTRECRLNGRMVLPAGWNLGKPNDTQSRNV
ncbi:hypothetical protein AVEN_120234-1 [Araneus ventricosus]|uniref:Uncharacterized protein n=1 Tax=Araneus ventricosus TaxID=182803 RepID=A0A4Y2RLZ7_ARAVE|nr:hypothetical protein AVEN_120234-1 [Araneus ventricosus]